MIDTCFFEEKPLVLPVHTGIPVESVKVNRYLGFATLRCLEYVKKNLPEMVVFVNGDLPWYNQLNKSKGIPS